MTPEQMKEEERVFWMKTYIGLITLRNWTSDLSAKVADEALDKYKERFSSEETEKEDKEKELFEQLKKRFDK